jgi:hypothetical protein
MTLCIKKDIFDENKLSLGKKYKINNNIFYNLNYKYDEYLINKFYFLTDWIGIKYYNKKNNHLDFYFNNDELKILLNKIVNKIKFNIPNQINQINHNNDNNVPILDDEIIENNQENNNQQPKNNHEDNIVSLLENAIELNYEELLEIDGPLRFNKTSTLILHPSKKSGLPEYNLNKIENENELKRYYPSINKNTDFKVVGKFLIYVNIFYLNKNSYGITFVIKSGNLKYEKTFIGNDKLHIKSIYNDKIKIEI